ncbi:hypothetical protein H310_09624 [Aphanomyces invadans]|uniref:Amino acid transporter transmembrane domain-containing protein n=1 Tax=Aphanomyces invadans TaxID=157072 RepID=A0A024TUF9_9STRA|nr:hypothetical protein H310_09624 [Aphanomyces invadans]ETV97261.1 hypothetical protein H310_09624 [Aphanomyces invadans]|eukprot:XP_008873969.1 hypothetical protein H310_09624 [Aphanomyces invadans]
MSNKSRAGGDVREPLLPLGANVKVAPPYGSPANTRDAYTRKLGYVPLIFQRMVNFVTTPRKMDRATTHGEAEASSFPHHQDGSSSSMFIPPPGSIRGSIFNLMGATLGAGALSLPYAVAVSGVGFALAQLFLAAFLTIYSISLLMRAGDITKLKSYEDLAMYCFGKRAELFVEVCIMVFSFGIAVAYLVTLGDLITPLGLLVFGPDSIWSTRWFLMSLFCATIMWPLSLLRDMTSLQFSSMLGVFSIIFLVVAVAIRSGMHIHQDGVSPSLDWGMNVSHGPDFMLSVPIVMFAFTNQPNVFSIFTELQRPCIRRMSKVVDRAAYASLSIYVVIGLVAYVAFGHSLADPVVKGNILLSFPMSDVLIAFARAAITFTVAVAYPMNIFPCRFSIDMMFFAQAKESLVRHVVVSTGLVITSLVLAIFCPNINVIFGIIGGTCSSVVCFCFPAAFVLKLEPGPICSRAKLGPLVLFIGSAIIGIVSTGVTIWSNFYAN